MKLRDYLDSEGIKHHVFARKLGKSTATLHNIMNGHDTFISVAWQIYELTNHEVKIKDLLPTKPPRKKKHAITQEAAVPTAQPNQ